ncbi:acetyl-CoA carboxylase, biotin carboxylase subunit [Sporobacter termitidis DSM 10068]|uniref:Biotin carboxylase n=1 Tax=Sporobacter termitidis DSM 10068 TaxID=1123282 RepID=A0A1M5X4A4_9FIRM|nr:acetyl-CoA carboxylase biotin carboxylase subunit [Sporobacter termitidis]SHH94053.1 acetyl-CoA carboxylase, biotin carboxylase subunit [Sporobacter termitidis DSM 10068]
MFSKILIANRGEVAIRIIRACKEMGIQTVAVYSLADKEALHVALADQSVCIGEASTSDSYLNAERIISAAIITKAQAIHPGYGFMSESPRFAELCKKNGIDFIGPSPEVISLMGDKDQARQMMKKAGVPVIPGTDILKNPGEAAAAAKRIGYPVLIKARSGGGGKGIRIVTGEEELENAFLTASHEAQEAFGDGAVYLEKQINPAKHIEIQLLADETGNIVCLAERECSIQRNNQKLIEESPSPAVDGALRARLTDAAIKAARAAGYCNAGTIEFLLDTDNSFYFMEMNVRLQVEHGITEQITGIDIVKWQIRIAAGVPLDFTQKDVVIEGNAIECRINASSVGRVTFLHVPGGPRVRFDSALFTGYAVPPFYDSLLGKLIVHAKTREEAIRKMHAALCELVIDGVPNNIDEQISILSDKRFVKGDYNTNFIKERGDD